MTYPPVLSACSIASPVSSVAATPPIDQDARRPAAAILVIDDLAANIRNSPDTIGSGPEASILRGKGYQLTAVRYRNFAVNLVARSVAQVRVTAILINVLNPKLSIFF